MWESVEDWRNSLGSSRVVQLPLRSSMLSTAALGKKEKLFPQKICLNAAEKPNHQPNSKLENMVIFHWNEAANSGKFQNRRYLAISTQKHKHKPVDNRS